MPAPRTKLVPVLALGLLAFGLAVFDNPGLLMPWLVEGCPPGPDFCFRGFIVAVYAGGGMVIAAVTAVIAWLLPVSGATTPTRAGVITVALLGAGVVLVWGPTDTDTTVAWAVLMGGLGVLVGWWADPAYARFRAGLQSYT